MQVIFVLREMNNLRAFISLAEKKQEFSYVGTKKSKKKNNRTLLAILPKD
jgi:hypothetical protein